MRCETAITAGAKCMWPGFSPQLLGFFKPKGG